MSFVILQRLTSKDHNIWDTTYDELRELDLPTSLKYGECVRLRKKYLKYSFENKFRPVDLGEGVRARFLKLLLCAFESESSAPILTEENRLNNFYLGVRAFVC